jgi:tartrate-resistant acid phosphatase type 5
VLTFLVTGDFGHPSQALRNVAAAMAAYASSRLPAPPSFILGLGDNFYPGGVTSCEDPQFQTNWADVFLRHDELKVPWHIVLGNHDYYGSPEAQIEFTTHERNPGGLWRCPDKNYAFSREIPREGLQDSRDGGGAPPPVTVDFFAIDTNGAQNSVRAMWPEMRGKLREFRDGLRERLLASTADYKVVFGHHPLFTKGRYHGREGVCLREREYSSCEGAVLPGYDMGVVLREGRASAYFSGHEHVFQHNDDAGVHHFVCGASGAEDVGYYGGENPDVTLTWTDKDMNHGFLAVTVDEEKMKVEFVNAELQVLHSVVIPKGLGSSEGELG